MSGGVDSSVAAALLVEQGYDVVGATMKLFCHGEDLPDRPCCSLDSVNDARRVCEQLGVPHYVLNLESAFGRDVVDDFVNEYARGRTPIPCVRCNTFTKFRDLLRKADAIDARWIATGHYAQVHDGVLHRGLDPAKDQSYFLWGINRGSLPLDAAIFLLQNGCPGGTRGILRRGVQALVFNRIQRLHQQLSPLFCKARRNLWRGFVRADISLALQQDPTGIQALINLHGGHSGAPGTAGKGPLNGGRAAQFRQQRSMHVDNSARRKVNHAARDNLPIPNNYHDFGLQRAQVFQSFRVADSFRLKNRQTMTQRRQLHRRRSLLLLSAFGPVGLGDNGNDFVTCFQHSFQRVYGKFRCTQKDRRHSHSPAFCILRILRLIRSRFKALR